MATPGRCSPLRTSITYYTHSSANTGDITTQIYIYVLDATGDITVYATNDCYDEDSRCAPGLDNFFEQPLVTGQTITGDVNYIWSGLSGAVDYEELSWLVSFQSPEVDGNQVISAVNDYFRCDSALPGSSSTGCVNYQASPTISYSAAEYPTFVQHVSAAQTSGLDGAPGGVPLYRTTDKSIRSANRSTACPTSRAKPTGYSCDEYPFASTYYGASSDPSGGRTFSWCQISDLPQGVTGESGYSACMINQTENSSAGLALQNVLYGPYRILDSDPFYVQTTS